MNQNTILSMQQSLEGKYKEVFISINLYIHNSSIDDGLQDEVLNDILDLFLQAQESNEDIDFIIGTDYQAFCDNVIAESMKKNSAYLKIIKFLKNTLWFISYYITLKTLMVVGLYIIGSDKTLAFNITPLDLCMLIGSIPGSYIVPIVVSKKAFKSKKLLNIILFSFLSMILLFAFLGIIVIISGSNFGNPYFSIPFYLPILVGWLVYLLLNRYYRNQCLKGA